MPRPDPMIDDTFLHLLQMEVTIAKLVKRELPGLGRNIW
jgi:hypothetical protein